MVGNPVKHGSNKLSQPYDFRVFSATVRDGTNVSIFQNGFSYPLDCLRFYDRVVKAVGRTRSAEPVRGDLYGTYIEYRRTTPFLIPRNKPSVLEFLSSMLKFQQDAEVKRLTRYKLVSIAYLVVSLLGLYLLAVLVSSTPISSSNLTFWTQLTFSCFGAICILGTIAGIYPSKCSSVRHFRSIKKSASQIDREDSDKKAVVLSGHHPTCGTFSSHVILFRGKTYCAGCTGLVAGAIASLFGILLYFLVGLNITESGKFIFYMGSVGVACGLLQYELPVNKGFVHFLLNIMFVLGAFFLLISVNEANSVGLDLYFLALTVYWIVTRIMMSRLEHLRMCATCGLISCSYSYR